MNKMKKLQPNAHGQYSLNLPAERPPSGLPDRGSGASWPLQQLPCAGSLLPPGRSVRAGTKLLFPERSTPAPQLYLVWQRLCISHLPFSCPLYPVGLRCDWLQCSYKPEPESGRTRPGDKVAVPGMGSVLLPPCFGFVIRDQSEILSWKRCRAAWHPRLALSGLPRPQTGRCPAVQCPHVWAAEPVRGHSYGLDFSGCFPADVTRFSFKGRFSRVWLWMHGNLQSMSLPRLSHTWMWNHMKQSCILFQFGSS